MQEIKLTIVVPVYNTKKYLPKLFDTLIPQMNGEIEAIFIDDGSDDGSLELLQQYKKENSNISVYEQKHLGATYARNVGIQHAKGKYVYFFDSDDYFGEGILWKAIKLLEQSDADILVGNGKEVVEDGRVRGWKFQGLTDRCSENIDVLYTMDSNPGNKIFCMKIVKKYHLLFDHVKIHQDLNFYLKYLIHCKKVQYMEDAMYFYLIREGSIATKVSLNIMDAVEAVNYVADYYKQHGVLAEKKEILDYSMVKHICYQIPKIEKLRTMEEQWKVFVHFEEALLKINMENNSKITQEMKLTVGRMRDRFKNNAVDNKNVIQEKKEPVNPLKISRDKIYLQVTTAWLEKKMHNEKLSDYFEEKQYKKIAIYGKGTLGNLLYEELNSSNIQVKCFIDQCAGTTYFGTESMPVVQLEELKEEVDCIVITPIHLFEEIKDKIKIIHPEKTVISLKEIL